MSKLNKGYLLAILLAFNLVGFAQQKVSVSGKLIDKDSGAPMEFATISLLNPNDSSLVTGNVTDAQGNFIIPTEPGKYLLKAQFISYNSIFKNIDVNGDLSLGTLTISQDVETLSEVVVKGQKAQMQLELDKRVFNVSENLNNIGADAAQILDNLPSVSVDVDGNVALRGSQNVRILVNGKPSGLVGLSSTEALRQLQGNLIERIEVVTNPSARYDAEGSAGVINIVLKKERRQGFNGAVTLNTGWPHDHGLSLNANLRKEWYNLFLNYGISYDESPGGGGSIQTFTDRDLITEIDRDRTRTDWSNTLRFGSEFFLNENNTLTVSLLTRISDEENFSTVIYEDFNNNGDLLDFRRRSEVEIEEDDNYEAELNYRKTFDEEGHEFSAAFQYRMNDEIETGNILELDLLDEGTIIDQQRSVNDQANTNMLLQADYVRPLSKGSKFEAGYRGTFRLIDTSFDLDTLDNGEWVTDFRFVNQFIYDEYVNAAYAIYENKMERWGYQIGLRAEHTYIDIYQPQVEVSTNKNYLNFFPSAFLSYKLTEENSLQASYSRRLSRPRFWYLNPFFSLADPRNIRTGNIDLDPEFTDSYEMGYLRNMDNSSFYFGGFYRRTTEVIERVSYVIQNDDSDIPFTTFSIPQNLGVEDAYGIEINYTWDPAKWVSINGNANFFRAITEGTFSYADPRSDEIETLDLSRDTYTANFRLNSRFNLGDYNIQLSGRYDAPEEDTQGIRRAIYSIDLGVNRDVLQGNGTLTFSVRDLLNTRYYRGTNVGPTWFRESDFRWRPRQFNLSFTYRINQQKERGRRGDRDGYDGGGDMDF